LNKLVLFLICHHDQPPLPPKFPVNDSTTPEENRAYPFIPIPPISFYQYTESPDERFNRSHGLRQLWGVLEYLPGTL
jgi:hypothetical protein